MKKIIVSSLIVLGLSTAAFAVGTTPDFVSIDADTSGGVSLIEAQVALPELTEEAFAAADIDVSGELSAAEFDALVAATVVPAS